MARNITGKEFDRNKYVLQHNNGGSGCINIKELSAKFGIITENEINQPGGILGYDANGKIPSSIVGDTSDSTIINGPTAINVLQTAQYTIVNYSSTTTYNITFNGGTWTRTGNTITVTAGNSVGTYTLNVNGTVTNISVVSFGPNKPTVVVSGINIVTGARLSISTNAYSSTNGSTHGSTSWQVATDAAFTNIIYQSVDNATNKTNIVTDVGNYTTYYVRARFKDQYNVYGLWSEVVSINKSSMSTTIATPSLTATALKITAGTKFTITGTAFADTGGSSHGSTIWQIAGDAGFTDIVYNNTDTTNKTSNVITVSQVKTTYYIRAKYIASNNVESVWSATISFNYAEIPVGLPDNQLAFLTPSNGSYAYNYGSVIGISNDGNTIMVSGKNFTVTGQSYFYIYKKNGSVWSQYAMISTYYKITRSCISGNGLVVYISTGDGYIQVYEDNGSTFVAKKLFRVEDSGVTSYGSQEYSILKCNYDGTRVIASGSAVYSSSTNPFAAVFTYVLNGGNVTNEWYEIHAGSYDSFGRLVGMSNDGTTAFIASNAVNGWSGQSVKVIRRQANGTWSQIGYFIENTSSYYFPCSVAMTGNGNTLLITESNTLRIYTYNGSTWTRNNYPLAISCEISDHNENITIKDDLSLIAITGRSESRMAVALYKYDGTTLTFLKFMTSDRTGTSGYYPGSLLTPDGKTFIVAENILNNAYPGSAWEGVYVYG